jgi:iron complex outermembrane receptor protein
MPDRHCRLLLAALWLIPGAAGAQVAPAGSPAPKRDLTELSLDELANITVTSVSKKSEGRSTVQAALHVLTREDIRRSGATTLPEILRLVPGVEVARLDSDHWSVGVRGFGDQFSKSVLVLIDGRNVYTPLFAGVFWAVQDLVLADVERIEVIRGPGGTVWGANAVNGVVNIITRSAADTHGTYASLGGGSVDQGIAEVRYGRGHGRFDYRAYGKAFIRGPQHHADGHNFDEWKAVQFGGRADWTPGPDDAFTFQGDLYTTDVGQRIAVSSFSPPGIATTEDPLDAWGANLLARWRRRLRGSGELQVEAYYDRTSLSAPNLREVRNTLDIDVVHHATLPAAIEITSGLGARLSPSDVTQTTATFLLDPRQSTTSIYSAFVQGEIPIIRDRLSMTLGSKLERHDTSGLEIQPAARLAYRVHPEHTVWAAVTRAVRTPSRLERDVRLAIFVKDPPPSFLQIDGNKDFRSETLIGYEVGYRALLTRRLYFDLAAFHNEYDDLQSFGAFSLTVDPVPPPPHITLHLPYDNGVRGSSEGFEVSLDSTPARWWQVKAGYGYLDLELEKKPSATDTLGAVAAYEGSTPRHSVTLQSRLDLPAGLQFDQTYRYVAALPYQRISSYHSLDLRAAWRLPRGVEFAVVGQNLLQASHAEFEHDHDPQVVVLIRRSVYAQIAWRP